MNATVTATETPTTEGTDCGHKFSSAPGIRMNARSLRYVTATVLHLAQQMGHGDGTTYADCVGCGHPAYTGMSSRNDSALNMGHVLADSQGGMYCVCNLLPLCRACNMEMGEETLTDVLVPVYDYRAQWDGTHVRVESIAVKDGLTRGRVAWKRPEGA